MNHFFAFLLLACSAACLAQAPQIKSGTTGSPEKTRGTKDKDVLQGDLSDLFRNDRLKINTDKVYPVDGNAGFRIASGIWMPEVPGNHLIEPEQVSIACLATERSCSVLRVRLRVSPWGIELEDPDETDFNIITWDAHGLLAAYGPDRVDKCHRSVLSMSFASGAVSLSDIPTREKGCEMFVNTNTYRLDRGKYYVDTTPNNNGPKF